MSKYIAPFILKTEYACHHCNSLPPDLDLNNIPVIYELLFSRFEEIRRQWGKSLDITSGYRCMDHQTILFEQKKSRIPYSVHIFGVALDIDVHNGVDVHKLVNIVQSIDEDMRIGYLEYLEKMQTFVHVDMGYLISPRYSSVLREGARW